MKNSDILHQIQKAAYSGTAFSAFPFPKFLMKTDSAAQSPAPPCGCSPNRKGHTPSGKLLRHIVFRNGSHKGISFPSEHSLLGNARFIVSKPTSLI